MGWGRAGGGKEAAQASIFLASQLVVSPTVLRGRSHAIPGIWNPSHPF